MFPKHWVIPRKLHEESIVLLRFNVRFLHTFGLDMPSRQIVPCNLHETFLRIIDFSGTVSA